MIKLINNHDWDHDPRWNSEQLVSVIRNTRNGADFGWLQKTASSDAQRAWLAKVAADNPGKDNLVHIVIVGDSDEFGVNRNADGYKKRWNRTNHKHFVDLGHVFRNHKNKAHKGDPTYGRPCASFYNDDACRIELVLDLDQDSARDILQAVESGKRVPWSMGANMAYDECTIAGCGNKATKPADYCFVAGTLIRMADGTHKNIEDVAVGDLILDKDGASTAVVHTMSRDVSEELVTYRNTINGLTTMCTANHPVWSASRDQGGCIYHKAGGVFPACYPGRGEHCEQCRRAPLTFDFQEAGNLTEGDYCAAPVMFGAQDASDLDEEFCWVLGLFVAEGSYGKVNGKHKSLQFSLHQDETAFIARLQKFFCERFDRDVKVYTREDSKGVSARVHSVQAAALFQKLCGEYANKKTVHPEIFNLPDCLAEAFLRGVLDGDGCYYQEKSYVRLNTASRDLAFQIAELFQRLGHVAYTSKAFNVGGPSSRTNTHDCWYVTSSYGFEAVASRVASSRRCIVDGEILGNVFDVGREQYVGKVYNLETESHTYVANGLSVHNCDHGKRGSLGRILADGQVCGRDNPDPHYFDSSHVWRPADRIAYAVRMVKAASDDQETAGGVLAAQEAGLILPPGVAPAGVDLRKWRALEKLASLESMLEDLPQALAAAAPEELDGGTIIVLNHGLGDRGDLRRLMGGMHRRGILLRPESFFRTVFGDQPFENTISPLMGEIRRALHSVFSDALAQGGGDLVAEDKFDADGDDPRSCGCRQTLDRLEDRASVRPEKARARAVKQVVIGPPKGRLIIQLQKTAAAPSVAASGFANLYASYGLAFAAHDHNFNPYHAVMTVNHLEE